MIFTRVPMKNIFDYLGNEIKVGDDVSVYCIKTKHVKALVWRNVGDFEVFSVDGEPKLKLENTEVFISPETICNDGYLLTIRGVSDSQYFPPLNQKERVFMSFILRVLPVFSKLEFTRSKTRSEVFRSMRELCDLLFLVCDASRNKNGEMGLFGLFSNWSQFRLGFTEIDIEKSIYDNSRLGFYFENGFDISACEKHADRSFDDEINKAILLMKEKNSNIVNQSYFGFAEIVMEYDIWGIIDSVRQRSQAHKYDNSQYWNVSKKLIEDCVNHRFKSMRDVSLEYHEKKRLRL